MHANWAARGYVILRRHISFSPAPKAHNIATQRKLSDLSPTASGLQLHLWTSTAIGVTLWHLVYFCLKFFLSTFCVRGFVSEVVDFLDSVDFLSGF